MSIVADESVDFGIVRILRQKGYHVISISKSFSGIEDDEVLEMAFQNKALLITDY